ncbi:MAG: sigma-70 family RNA polymerase sigma factor [Muribaculaceae bacterium]|nr:sigma-70 family RNA polymerase sigma factor [Muribaculaceae bacterium]
MTAAAFKERVCVHLDAMYRVALALCGNSADASDAVQNAAIKLWESRDKLDAVANTQAYCIAAARNAAISLISSRRHPDSLDTAGAVAADKSLESEIETSDRIKHIKAIAATLPDNQRIVLTMRDFEGCEMDEIEEATGLSAGNIRVLLSRARSTIRKYFEK